MERPSSDDMMPKRDQERDLELDKKIEALRRKNEALMKRYKEVEEDRRRAEEEGMALQSRKGKADDLTITISKSTSDNRVVVTKPFSGGAPAGKQEETGPDGGEEGAPQGTGLGHRKQLMVTMAGKKGKRVVSERPEKRPGPEDVKSPADDGQTKRTESAGRGKQPHHMTKRDPAVQDQVKQGQKHTEEHHGLSEQCQEPENPQASTDLNIPTSKEEQGEYLRWKKEREQIDRERVARHKNAKGQWRRAWDVDKTENMFSAKSLPDRDWGPSGRGGRNVRRGQSKAESRGHEKRGKDKGSKNVLVMSSKAKGIERLTGRARRWQANEEGENLEMSDTTLEEFLEELDAFTDAEVEDQKEQDSKVKPGSAGAEETSGSTDPVSATRLRDDSPTPGRAEAFSPRGSEKKVRFSEELIQAAPAKQNTSSLDESRNLSALKASSPKKTQQPLERIKQDDGRPQDQGGGPSGRQQASETECSRKDNKPPAAPRSTCPGKACGSLQDCSGQPVELGKCNISNTNTEELIDSGLSVLSLESGETHPAHSTSSDKAREHGKIV